MNDQVREAVARALKERGLSQKDFAESIDLEPPNLSRLLSGKSGRIPENWQRVLDALELDLIAVPRN